VELLKATILDLRKQGKTILFSSHRMDHVEELCQKICILHKSNTVLQGNLREIKGTFPKERILLDTTAPIYGLEQIEGVAAVRKLESGYEIKISDVKAAEPILTLAMQQAGILHFQIMEPTLNEIFIKKVGNNHE
jgi:ABC-2 type transport system ATP-binding protein